MTARTPGQPAQHGHRGPRVVSPAPRDVWRDLSSTDPGALPTQTPEWTDWLSRTRGFSDASRLYEFPDGRRLLLPLLARTAAGVTVTEESMPYGFGYGGPLVAGGRVTLAEARAVLADLARRPVLRAGLVPDPLTAGILEAAAPPGTVRVPYLAHVLDLDGGFDRVWRDRFRSDIRKNIRRASRQPLEIGESRDGDVVDTFAELNRRSVDRWAHDRGQPLWLAHLVERRRDRVEQLSSAIPALGSMLTSWTAHLHGEPVAAYVLLRSGERAYAWMSAMDTTLARRTDAGALLQSLAIEDACATGARQFLMGEAAAGSGVAVFKERFGAEAVPFAGLRFERLPMTAAERGLRSVLDRVVSAPRHPFRREPGPTREVQA
ncbi:GNAT family N-acetyltransferase [Geodermatophilus sp. DSM 45219]|uniref:GNAT family N-acetyltransferase n=1 Tax=Geodermatophilus sp. DSM 45219 TaxID=1881103 RepID=UPI00159FEEEB|nr:GNAT family N-acetyltransferase [Geodermatophilus sp. DSM 45219]